MTRKAAPAFRLTAREAAAIEEDVVGGVRTHFQDAADVAQLTSSERSTIFGREVLNPYIFFDTP